MHCKIRDSLLTDRKSYFFRLTFLNMNLYSPSLSRIFVKFFSSLAQSFLNHFSSKLPDICTLASHPRKTGDVPNDIFCFCACFVCLFVCIVYISVLLSIVSFFP